MKISCIAVDDEPLALGLIKSYILRTPELELSGEFSTAITALNFLRNNPVDLIFLDIRMPELSGIELARILDQKGPEKPRVIFTTAYDNYALEGFRVDALDYLLKPFNYVDFYQAYQKAEAYFRLIRKAPAETGSSNTGTLPETMTDPYLYLKVEYQLVKIAKADILYIESLKDYVKIFLLRQDKPVMTLTTLKALEAKLDPGYFLRLHRSYIVSLEKITSVTRNSVHIGDTVIPVTEVYKEAFGKFLDRWK